MPVLNFNDAPKTHEIVATFKTRNGRRRKEIFPISEEQATTAILRAAAVSGAANYGHGQGWLLVNWTLREKTEKEPQ